MARLDVGWALHGKVPLSRAEYGVIGSSRGVFSPENFETLLGRFTPGTPPATRQGTEALPWITVNYVPRNGDPYLGVALHEWSDQVDGTNRDIARISYFCVPYRQLRDQPVSYAELFRALGDVRLPWPETQSQADELRGTGRELVLHVAPLDAEVMAEEVRGFGRGRVTAAAALLLDGPVTIVQCDLSAQHRLRFLDAVASLLPYGLRTAYSAATWMEGGASGRIRICFSRRPRADRTTLDWRSEIPEIPETSPRALAYRDRLEALFSRGVSLTEVIGHLAARHDRGQADEWYYVWESLGDMDAPLRVLRGVRDGSAEPAEVRRLLERGRSEVLTSEQWREILLFLVGLADPADLALLGACWGEDDPRLGAALGDAALSHMLRGDAQDRVAEYVAFAGRHGLPEDLFVPLLRPPVPVRSAAALLRRHAGPGTDPDGPFARAARAWPPLVYELLLQELDAAPRRIGEWLDWLGSGGRLEDVLTPFEVVLRDRGGAPVGKLSLGNLLEAGEAYLMRLLREAARRRCLPFVLGAFTELAAERSFDREQRSAWARSLTELEVDDAASRAEIDALLLLFGGRPRFLDAMAGNAEYDRPGWSRYCRALAEVWRTDALRGHHTVLADRLAAHLEPWRERPGDDPLRELARELTGIPGLDWEPLRGLLRGTPRLLRGGGASGSGRTRGLRAAPEIEERASATRRPERSRAALEPEGGAPADRRPDRPRAAPGADVTAPAARPNRENRLRRLAQIGARASLQEVAESLAAVLADGHPVDLAVWALRTSDRRLPERDVVVLGFLLYRALSLVHEMAPDEAEERAAWFTGGMIEDLPPLDRRIVARLGDERDLFSRLTGIAESGERDRTRRPRSFLSRLTRWR
ncbi:hypothetical protein [Streptosporangium sp. NPDC051022]|uniref:hypothetical protein n=1 Tax=Streptosporangium sp. NPDC051022 TaxID=3155752 RepID=UPI003418CA29